MLEVPSYQSKIIFPTYHRLMIETNYDEQKLITIVRRHLKLSVINGIKAPESIIGKIQNVCTDHFSNYKRISKRK